MVIEAEHLDSGEVKALKIAHKRFAGHFQSCANEITILQRMPGHPAIMPIISYHATPTSLVSVTDVYAGGTLLDIICDEGCPSIDRAKHYFRQLVEALEHCHRHEVVHRDLKLEHLALSCDREKLVLLDFGVSIQCKAGSKISEHVGSAEYVAPEVLKGLYQSPADMWSAGVVLYALLSGLLPFQRATHEATLDAVRSGFVPMPPQVFDTVEPVAKDLLHKLLNPDPDSRYTAQAALSHEWLQS